MGKSKSITIFIMVGMLTLTMLGQTGQISNIGFKKNPSSVRAPSALKTVLKTTCFEGAWRPNLLQSFS